MNRMQENINRYYKCMGIAPADRSTCFEERFEAFDCPKKEHCRCACRAKKKDAIFSPPVDGVCVSQYYEDGCFEGHRIPRIVVLSLSPPKPQKPNSMQKEKENKESPNRSRSLNPHWRETLAMVRSILHCHVPTDILPCPARRWNDKSVSEIQSLFVHARTAKCCSNANGKNGKDQEPGVVYDNCGEYLIEELKILKPHVIITQGKHAHRIVGKHAFASQKCVTGIEGIDPEHNIAYIAHLRSNTDCPLYWLKSYHPRYSWGFYKQAGGKIECERNVIGAKRKNFVRYGEEIRNFMED